MIETTETKTCNRCGESYREGWLGHQCRDRTAPETSYARKAEAELDEPCTPRKQMTATHDSETCTLANGQPCEICRWANECERRYLDQLTFTPEELEQARQNLLRDIMRRLNKRARGRRAGRE